MQMQRFCTPTNTDIYNKHIYKLERMYVCVSVGFICSSKEKSRNYNKKQTKLKQVNRN